MGLNTHGARFLRYARSIGVDFAQTATIGRQGLYVAPAELARLLSAFGDDLGEGLAQAMCADGFAEGYLQHLGATEVHSFDYSPFEGATHTFDMNLPAPPGFAERYSVVLDGGALEHIFNFPVAIKNCMEMVRVGGRYLAITPANNFFGHGFYQFSPELYFSVLSPENGFELERMIAFEDVEGAPWYTVLSPREARGRVALTNSRPVHLLVIARRTASKPIFERPPQQSDYLARWEDAPADDAQAGASVERPLPIRLAKAALPSPVRRALRWAFERVPRPRPTFDPRFFRSMAPATIAGGHERG